MGDDRVRELVHDGVRRRGPQHRAFELVARLRRVTISHDGRLVNDVESATANEAAYQHADEVEVEGLNQDRNLRAAPIGAQQGAAHPIAGLRDDTTLLADALPPRWLLLDGEQRTVQGGARYGDGRGILGQGVEPRVAG